MSATTTATGARRNDPRYAAQRLRPGLQPAPRPSCPRAGRLPAVLDGQRPPAGYGPRPGDQQYRGGYAPGRPQGCGLPRGQGCGAIMAITAAVRRPRVPEYRPSYQDQGYPEQGYNAPPVLRSAPLRPARLRPAWITVAPRRLRRAGSGPADYGDYGQSQAPAGCRRLRPGAPRPTTGPRPAPRSPAARRRQRPDLPVAREGANVVGRGQDAQFRLPDTGVPRRHLASVGTARWRS